MTTAWYIDTLDARGGIAFASYRDSESAEVDGYHDALSSVFVSAPSFSAEPLVHRATSLAAGRGVFQEGLFLDGREVPFANLSDVIAFVARIYGSSGGGDGAGGAAPPPRPEGSSPPEGSPEPEGFEQLPDRELVDVLPLLVAEAGRFIEFHPVEVGSPGKQFAWFESIADPLTASYGATSLEKAAVRLEWEIWSRLPETPGHEALLRWLESASSLLCLVDVIGLDRQRLHHSSVSSRDGSWFARLIAERTEAPDFLPLLHQHPDGLSLFDQRLLDVLHPDFPLYRWEDCCQCGDVITLLCRMPLSGASRDALAGSDCPDDDRSLFHLLTAAAAAPERLIRVQVAEEFFLAACAVISSARPQRAAIRSRLVRPRALRDQLQLAALSRLQRETLGWLKLSLPNRSLPRPLETMISNAPGLAYA